MSASISFDLGRNVHLKGIGILMKKKEQKQKQKKQKKKQKGLSELSGINLLFFFGPYRSMPGPYA